MLILLIILFGSFAVLSLADRMGRPVPVHRRGAISLGILFLFTGSAHYYLTQPMTLLLPPWVPAREIVIYLSGIVELALGAALISGRQERRAGWAAILFFLAVFPSNVYGAIQHIPFGGHVAGPKYLLLRGPLQLLFILWAWTFCVRTRVSKEV